MCSDEEIIIENHSSPCLKPATQHNQYFTPVHAETNAILLEYKSLQNSG